MWGGVSSMDEGAVRGTSAVMITEDLGTHLAAGRWGSKVLRLSNSVGV